jgi:hypothetical protein
VALADALRPKVKSEAGKLLEIAAAPPLSKLAACEAAVEAALMTLAPPPAAALVVSMTRPGSEVKELLG